MIPRGIKATGVIHRGRLTPWACHEAAIPVLGKHAFAVPVRVLLEKDYLKLVERARRTKS